MKQTNPAITTKRRVGCGLLYATLIYDEETNKPISFQFILGKSGGCAASQLNGIQTLINYIIKLEGDLEEIFDKDNRKEDRSDSYSLLGIRCPEVQHEDEIFAPAPEEKLNLSCSDVIAKSIRYLLGKLEEKK